MQINVEYRRRVRLLGDEVVVPDFLKECEWLRHKIFSKIWSECCHSRESGSPVVENWIPAFAGMTLSKSSKLFFHDFLARAAHRFNPATIARTAAWSMFVPV